MIDKMFEDVEYSEPAKAFKAGHELTILGKQKQKLRVKKVKKLYK